jgi:hypothetical protein
MLKRLLVAISTAVVLTTAHADIVGMLMPSPWTVGIALVRWIATGPEKVLYAEVVGEGVTVDEARLQGFRLAVEHAVGTVVASETEVKNSRVARDEIITYASGFVDRFEIVDQQQVGNRLQLRMKIWVKPSKLANRLLNESKTAGQVDGGRISNQINSIVHERKSGDRLLQTVLSDYPRRAFVLELEKTRVLFDDNRKGQLEVAYFLTWSPDYLESLATAITAINQRPDCGGFSFAHKCTSVRSEISVTRRGWGSTTSALFDDNVAEQLIRSEMIQSQPTIRLTIVDAAGNQQFKQCLYARELDHASRTNLQYVEVWPNKVNINGNAGKRFNHFIDLSTINSSQLDKVELSMVRGPGC